MTEDEMNERVAQRLEEVKQALDMYLKGYQPGGFLTAVLENDLFGALHAADKTSQEALVEICKYIYNELPIGCWGSPEKVQAVLSGEVTF